MRTSMFAAAALFALPAFAQTDAGLNTALQHARIAWGGVAEATIRFMPLGGCSEKAHEHAAISEPVTEFLIFTDEDGKEISRQPMSTHWTISINPSCKWTPEYLDKVVLHEYGHVIGLQHSTDQKSIMYWIVWRDRQQSITAADRAR